MPASCCTTTRANPSDNSSMIKTSGSDMSPRAIASICCSPPENVPAFWRAAFLQPRKQRVDLIEPLGEATPRALGEGAHLQVLLHAHRAEQLAPFRHQHQSARGLGVRGQPVTSSPAKNTLPPNGWMFPVMARRLVVLPAPLAPTSVVMRAARHAERNAPEHLDLVIARLQGLHAQAAARSFRDLLALTSRLGRRRDKPR